jgi:WD40 repeat protein
MVVAGRQASKDEVAIPMSGSWDFPAAASASLFAYLGKEPTLSNVSSGVSRPTNDPPSPTWPTLPSASAEWDLKFFEQNCFHDNAISGCASFPIESIKPILVMTLLDGGLIVHTVEFRSATSAKSHRKVALLELRANSCTSPCPEARYHLKNKTSLQKIKTSLQNSELIHCRTLLPACQLPVTIKEAELLLLVDMMIWCLRVQSLLGVLLPWSICIAMRSLDLTCCNNHLPPSKPFGQKKWTHVMVSGSWDATIKAWSVVVSNGETVSIDREPLAELSDTILAPAIPDGQGDIVVAAGSADGSFCTWHLHIDGDQNIIHKGADRGGSGPCSVIQWSSEGGRLTLYTGYATEKVASYILDGGSIRKAGAALVGVAVQSLKY